MPKQKQPQPEQLRIVSKPPTLSVDGNTVTLNNLNYGDLTFFQISQKVGNIIEAHGIASIRMTLDQFKALRNNLNKVINEHEEKMKNKEHKNEETK